MDKQALLDLKDDISDAKTRQAELNGQKEILLKQLKDNFDCTSVEAAQKLLKRQDKDIEILKDQIREGIIELEENYDFS